MNLQPICVEKMQVPLRYAERELSQSELRAWLHLIRGSRPTIRLEARTTTECLADSEYHSATVFRLQGEKKNS